MDTSLTQIPKSSVAAALDTLPKRYIPQFLLRKIDKTSQETRLRSLRENEKAVLKEFLDQVHGKEPIEIKITPLMARAILIALNYRNPRGRINLKRLLHHANEMALGRWRISTDHIGIVNVGRWLMNGQHRLGAIEVSGMAQTYYVDIVPESSAKVADQHQPRTSADNTGLTSAICQAAKAIYATGLESTDKASTFTIEEIYAAYQESIDLTLDLKLHRNGVIKAATLAWCHGQLADSPAAQKKVEKFIDQFAKGAMLAPTDIAYKAREYFRNNRKSIGQWETNLAAFHKLCNCCYNVIHNIPVGRLQSNESAAQWFREQDMEKVESLRTKPLQ